MVLNRATPVALCSGSAPAVTLFSLLMMNVFILLLLPRLVVRTFITPGSAEGKFNLAVAPAAAPAGESVVEMGITSAGLGLRRTNGGMTKTYVRPPARKLNRCPGGIGNGVTFSLMCVTVPRFSAGRSRLFGRSFSMFARARDTADKPIRRTKR